MDIRSVEVASEIARPFESLSLAPYHDPVGFPTGGYGHLYSRVAWDDLSRYPTLPDEAAAEELLQRDMMKALASVRRLIVSPLTDEQEGALVDFAFNLGSGNLQVSTLRRVVNRREYAAAPEQFMRWTYAGGRRLRGLVRRREAEVVVATWLDLWG